MTDNRKDDRHISRRRLLQRVPLVLGAGVATQAASCMLMRPTLSKADARYQDMPNGTQRCAGCVHFQAPNACSVVQGTISPDGWCQRYSAKG